MTFAVRARGVCKAYHLGSSRHAATTLREALAGLVRRRPAVARPADELLWALRDVSFEIAPGEVVGAIGRNGAGKSTLLKILSRVVEPTEGEVTLRGRVGSLLEVGTGFHPELTGAENVYLNGALLGMSRAEVRRKFDQIVAFAGVERFLDTPVKRYSSGMYMRLAFAVAAHLDPEILLVDEVLAVGDIEFQRRCLGRMEEVAATGRTVVLVSHNLGAIRGLCRRAILIEGGRVAADGPASQVVDEYLALVARGLPETTASSTDQLFVERVLLRDASGAVTHEVAPGDDLTIEVVVTARAPVDRPFLWIGVGGRHGSLFAANNLLDDFRPERLEGTCTVRCRFRALPLMPQPYVIRMGARAKDGVTPILSSQDLASFSVSGSVRRLGFQAEAADALAWNAAPVLAAYEWELPDGRRFEFEPTSRRGPEGSARGEAAGKTGGVT